MHRSVEVRDLYGRNVGLFVDKIRPLVYTEWNIHYVACSIMKREGKCLTYKMVAHTD
jgi:hypothetical protein